LKLIEVFQFIFGFVEDALHQKRQDKSITLFLRTNDVTNIV